MFDKVLGPKYAKILNEYGKVLNITEFHSKYASISQCSEYARMCQKHGSKYATIG